MLDLLDECYDIAALMASEAIKHLLIGGYGKRRCIFGMKRTKAEKIVSGILCKLHILTYDRSNVASGNDFFHYFIWDSAAAVAHRLCPF